MRKRPKNIQAGRPPTARPPRAMSRKASRALINRHHQLDKARRQASSRGDAGAEAAASAALAALGGLGRYQQASLQGQSAERGGDTSRVLLEWLRPARWAAGAAPRRPRVLDVGALSTRGACAASGLFDVVHIDLASREPGILRQDFMQRPRPAEDADRFDVVSLSLVLNFVPDAAARGRMLARSLCFLRGGGGGGETGGEDGLPSPSLFLVLPRSCLTNSRYFTEARLEELMAALGYGLCRAKMTQKLAYSLWERRTEVPSAVVRFPKSEVNPGRTRNNFVITLDSDDAT